MVPLLFGLSMLAILVAVGLSANTGLVKADSSCQYAQTCTSNAGGNSTPLWAWAAIGVIVFLAVLVTALLVLRRRRPPSSGSGEIPPGVEPWSGPVAGPTAPEGPGASTYVEGPEDVATAPPDLPTPPSAVAGAAAGAAVGAAASAPGEAEGETNIDALMDELDRISGEMLRKDKPKGPGAKPAPESPPTDETE